MATVADLELSHPAGGRSVEYKVLTERDSRFSGAFDPKKPRTDAQQLRR